MSAIVDFPQKATPGLVDLVRLVTYAQADPRLLPSSKSVLTVILLGHFNIQRQRAWPSLNTLASETRLSRDAVKRSVRQLRLCGYLLVISGKGRTSTNYGVGPKIHHVGYLGGGVTSPSEGAPRATKQAKGTVRAISKQQSLEVVGQGRATA